MMNPELVDLFETIATMMEFLDENPFRVRAYQRAAERLEDLEVSVDDLTEQEILALDGIGKDLTAKILEYRETGKLEFYDELAQQVPMGLFPLLAIGGLGPKKLRKIYDGLGVETVDEVIEAAQAKRLQTIKGFSKAGEAKLLEAMEALQSQAKACRLVVVDREWAKLAQCLEQLPGVEQCAPAGPQARRQDTVTHVVGVVSTNRVDEAMAAFQAAVEEDGAGKAIESVEQANPYEHWGMLRCGLPFTLRWTRPKQWATQYWMAVGPKEHTDAVMAYGKTQSIDLRPQGIMDGTTPVVVDTEADLYKALGLPWIPPECRHVWTSPQGFPVDQSHQHKLEAMISRQAIRGDFHMHTTDSDGRHEVEDMVAYAQELGHEYVAMTNHSVSQYQAHGLDANRAQEHMNRLADLQAKFPHITLLKGIEVDILSDGRLDLPDEILAQMDVVVASVHNQLGMEKEAMTQRLLKAIEHPLVHIIGHPTGRLVLDRKESDYDRDVVFKRAAETGTCLEINASPHRMDLNDSLIRQAHGHGVRFVISTDAHHRQHLDNMPYGLAMARRAGLTAEDVQNTRPWEEIRTFFATKKQRL